ncbi:uncharacterized protein NFIA_023430 [Aspergillus fischeri NRRL 181]|uniref:Uncharacterized protein n=1 Tax=Neosartorya fischeri (strain ATCC 1020 / DSM 3700 / CBS 544.65 / FGSC A1164 / JCM 1740 / NRRL 181 / WB 181) TaxID=331117 RepID=A1D5D9_NEOFI|nr:uncharacterized protein NFIA_023430 [Aspergillus fischeri NRRL 181]EAW23632.1 hypothetical protein NFIA_023430 [Aspergillus fischeri NRRL 181]
MPILHSPSSKRLFGSAHCPPHCKIPAYDCDAYELYPKFRWVYNKLTVAELQGIECEKYIADFVETHLTGYTGMMNVETIGGKIIEAHLRFSPQWPNMYGSWFTSSLVDLYCGKGWTGPLASKIATPVGYSVPLWDDEKYAKTGTTLTDNAFRRLESMFNVESITMQYSREKPLESTPRPSGGFRIAWVNGYDLARCKLARSALQAYLHQLDDTEQWIY